MDEATQIPELDHVHFSTEVMQLGADETELQHDRELLAQAHGLGIMATLPTVSKAHRVTSSATSDSTESTSREQAFSTISDGSTVAYLTPHSSVYGAPCPNMSDMSADDAAHKTQARTANFSSYDRYLAQVHLVRAESPHRESTVPLESSGQSIFSVSTRKSLSGVTSGFRNRIRLRKKSARAPGTPSSCCKCHSPLNASGAPSQSLPCGHVSCAHCLRDLVVEAIKHESSMPPSCCAKPVPSETIQRCLDIDVQESFLKAVLQYSTPSESRLFCCNPVCGEFMPPLERVGASMPSTVTCPKCQFKACTTCKQGAHEIGTHCPRDWELLDALKIGGSGSWCRCYRCRKLVELTETTETATCACGAQFCYACGGVWDAAAGCPNKHCKGEQGLADGRGEEQQRVAEADAAARATQRDESEKRSREHPEVQFLLDAQRKEMQRMLDFKESAQASLKARQSAQEVALASKHVQDREELVEKQSKATSQMEDRQITEELDLRSTLAQAARSIKVRIKHMEAYCDGLGQNPSVSNGPPRVVTEQNLRDLGHQYNLRDDMERQHQAKINMMRDRQSKRMEELAQKHKVALEALVERNQKAMDELRESLPREQKTFESVFEARRSRLTSRWILAIEVQCKQLQERDGLEYSILAPPTWPEPDTTT
ncbi:hypothetical protein C2857_006560 [Epichloe festucae Fl1]|uniref:RBR-type E3 ubiquitin transferase n=1 Tax=Epichloe festucae (strain Fl1) TaxID=877507 RepID=A0A7S9PSR5_EPIFF|nr:hypothetical protein C2857_006560 [Epichloe festucae Fl1]